MVVPRMFEKVVLGKGGANGAMTMVKLHHVCTRNTYKILIIRRKIRR
jgi:hypothetical protein